jgi:hypothetical protein
MIVEETTTPTGSGSWVVRGHRWMSPAQRADDSMRGSVTLGRCCAGWGFQKKSGVTPVLKAGGFDVGSGRRPSRATWRSRI